MRSTSLTCARAQADGPRGPRSIADLPGPRGLPLIGVAHRLLPTTRMHLTIEGWGRRYGPIVRADVGRRTIVGVSDPDEIHRILRERPEGFRRWRDQEVVFREMRPVGVFAAEGQSWRRQRRLVVTALNTNHLQRYFDVVRTTTERLHGRLAEAARAGRPLEISRMLTSFTLDTISWLAFGHDLNTLEHHQSKLQDDIQRVFFMQARRLAAPVAYWRFVRLPADRALERSVAALQAAIARFSEEARARIAARPELAQAPENMLEAMLAAQQVDGSFSDEEIAGNVFALMIAGEDTTAHTLAWTVWFLARRPDVQARLAQEAEELLGERVAPADYKTVNASRYGEAVLRESMRLKSVAPLALVEPLTDMAICGTQIPAHTCLLLALRLANLAQEPSSEFDPERFLGEDQERASKSLVFGAGPRFCPGRNLAFLEAKSALLAIARNFEVELDDSAAPVTERFGFTMAPGGLRVRLKQRAAAPSFVHAAAGLR